MCGRYTQSRKQDVLQKTFAIDKIVAEIFPSYNVCPGQNVATIAGHGERRLGTLRWGLPSLRAGGRPLINARAETLREKPTFQRLLPSRRCLFVADGFYEWQRNGARKQPVYIHLKDRAPMVFAGLWDAVPTDDGGKNVCGTIITTQANDLLSPVHHRMPVIIPPDAIDAWLDPENRDVDELLRPYPDDTMRWYRVSDAVNSAANDGPELVEALGY